MPAYTNNLPVSTNPPRLDQPLMTANTQYLAADIGVDHNFTGDTGNAKDGYHKVIHFVDNGSTTPPQVVGVGQLYTNTVAGDQVLFYESGNGVVNQITSAVAAVVPVRAYANFAGRSTNGPCVVNGGFNITSITRGTDGSGAAIYSVVLATSAPTVNYSVAIACTQTGTFAQFGSIQNAYTNGGVATPIVFKFIRAVTNVVIDPTTASFIIQGG